jgi:hypothetical protein
LRKYGFQGRWVADVPELRIVEFHWAGASEAVTVRRVGNTRVRDTRVRAADGWRRRRHEKLLPDP